MDTRSIAEYLATASIFRQARTRAVKRTSPSDAIAFSYLRFSSPAQAEGDSIRRQEALRDNWLKRHPGVRLDKTLRLADEGVSGYSGANRQNSKHALAQFVERVNRGLIPPGSFLLIENMDRLSREKPVVAVNLLSNLLVAGIRVVQLAPDELELDVDSDLWDLFRGQMSQARGHDESKRKSGNLGNVWSEKKVSARNNLTPYGRMCPAWLELEGAQRSGKRLDYSKAKFRVKADAAKAVRRVFELCANGVGTFGILDCLNNEGVKAIGRSGSWDRSYVKKLLGSVAVLGTYQPHSGSRGPDRKPDGKPIPNFYPAIISKELWYRAHEAMKNRTRRSGRPAKEQPNPFAGLLRDARDDCPLHVAGSRGHKYLVSAKALQKAIGSEWRAFPLDVFTSSVLKELAELKAADLFKDPGAAKLVELQTQLSDVDRRLTSATAQFEADPESAHWQNLVSKYDRERRAIVKELAEERQRAANPLSSVWVEAVELMARNEPARLRAALLSVCESVSCVFAVAGGVKVAVVQVWFHGGEHREYFIHYTPHRGPLKTGKAAKTIVKTLKELALPVVDLRDLDQAQEMERTLLRNLKAQVAQPPRTTENPRSDSE